jgi:hypothetical protein
MSKALWVLLFCLSSARAYDLADPAYPVPYSEAQKSTQRAQGTEVLAGLRAALNGKSPGFTIPPGVYRIKGTIALDKVKDFTLTAANVELILENTPPQDFMALNDCDRVTIRGPLIIDCDPLVFSQGTIRSFNSAAKTLDVRIHDGYRTALKPGRFMLFLADGTWLPQTMHDFSDPEAVDAGTVRITVPDDKESVNLYKAGNLIAMEGPGAGFACRNSNYSFEDITLYGGYNMFAWEDRSRGPNLYLRCKIIRRPGTNRLIGGAGPQQNYVSGGPIYDGCEFAHSWDDNINLLNNIHMVWKQESPRTVIVKPGSSFTPFAAGDTASFYRFDSFAKAGWAKVLAVENITDAGMIADANALARTLQPRDLGGQACVRLSLDRDLSLLPTDYAESSNFRPRDVVIRNCHFHDFMCRTMIQGVRGAIIENNVIERAGLAAIDVRLDAYWWEGPTSENVIIRGNTIRDSPYSLFAACCAFQMSAAISVGPSTSPGKNPAKEYLFKDFRIQDNLIINPMFAGILAKNIDGLVVSGNTIENPVTRSGWVPGSQYYGEDPLAGIYLHAVKNASITGNRMSPSPRCTTVVKVGHFVDMPTLKISDNTLGSVGIKPSPAGVHAPSAALSPVWVDAEGRRLPPAPATGKGNQGAEKKTRLKISPLQ